jgi:POT family proton-dependent oligopeptide transporter
LCLAVLCERWAAAILSSSLVFMLCQNYGHSRGEALRLCGLYNAASYFLTLPGGFAIDRILGARRSLSAGMVLLTCGYAALTIPSALWLSAPLLLLGHALFKPSSQVVLALLYERHDRRLDGAQIAVYLVINVAVTAGSVCAGLLSGRLDFRASFTLATAVLLIGTLAVFLGKSVLRLRPKQLSPRVSAPTPPLALSSRQRVQRIAALTLAMLLFAVGFGQVEGSLLLWARDRTDRFLLGFEIPAAWFVGLPALLVLLLAPAQLALLPRLQQTTTTPRLVAWGLVAVALAFAVLLPPALLLPGQRVSMLWLLAAMTLLVTGELLISPLGLSLLLRLAPPRFVGVVLGVWYVAGALGCWLAGELGALWATQMQRRQ